MNTPLWDAYVAPVMDNDVAREVLLSGFLTPYDMAFTIMQGKALIVWPMIKEKKPVKPVSLDAS